MKKSFRKGLTSLGLSAAIGLTTLHAAPVHAQYLPSGVHVGMSLSDLQSAAVDLRRVSRPERMANGSRGLWQQVQTGDDGLVFETTYFVRGSAIDRIDLQLASAPEGPAAGYERIVGTLRAQFGAGLQSHEVLGSSVSDTASWADGDQDIAAYMTGQRDAEKVHVVFKRRELKDGAAL